MGGDGRSRATEVFGAGGAAYLQTPPQARTSRAGEPFFSYDGAVRIGGVVTHASVNGGGRRARGPQRREYVVKAKPKKPVMILPMKPTRSANRRASRRSLSLRVKYSRASFA